MRVRRDEFVEYCGGYFGMMLRCMDLTMVRRNTFLTRDQKAAVTQRLNTHKH